jgi:hypothetical protein
LAVASELLFVGEAREEGVARFMADSEPLALIAVGRSDSNHKVFAAGFEDSSPWLIALLDTHDAPQRGHSLDRDGRLRLRFA